MLNWHRLLIEWPAKLFDAWWTMYRLVLTVVVMAIFTTTVIALVLELGFGIRWGW
jgi:hypothetical protein